MMLPNQIATQQFSSSGKGGFKADEVTAFLKKVYQSYNKLYMDNKALNDKVDELLPIAQEYNQTKNTIAEALILAKSTAEKDIQEATSNAQSIVFEATAKAEKLMNDTRAQADAYYKDKTLSANKQLEQAQTDLENLKKQSETYSEKYIAKINAEAQSIIDDANEKAALIVANAYGDAKSAREKSESVISQANAELARLKNEAARIRKQISGFISEVGQAVEKIDDTVFSPIESVSEKEQEIKAERIEADSIEKFTFDAEQVKEEEIEPENVTAETHEPEKMQTEQESAPFNQEYVSFYGENIPNVNAFITDLFTKKSDDTTDGEEENSFKFEKVVSDFDRPEERKPFDFLKKDSGESFDF